MAVLRKLNTEINLSGDGDKELRAWIKDLVDARKEGVSMSGGINEMEKEMIDAARQIGLTRDQLKDMAEASRKTKEIEAFSSKYGFAMSDIQKHTNAAKDSVNGLGSALKFIAAAGVGAKLKGIGGEMLDLAMKAETAQIQMEVMLKSPEKAKETLKMLKEFSDVTPFSDEEAIAAGKQLINAKVPLDQLKQTLLEVGDVAAGSGIGFGELAEIYSKNKMSGLIQLEDVNQLAGRGIPIMDELAKVMGVGSEQIRGLTSSGAIKFKHLQQAFANMSKEGGTYAGMMDKLSQSGAGLYSTFDSKLAGFRRSIGADLLDAMKPVWNMGIKFLDWLQKSPVAMGIVKTALLILVPIVGVILVAALYSGASAAVAFGIKSVIAFTSAIPPALSLAAAVLAATWPFILIGAAIVALGLIFEDLWVWMEGGESLFGGWIEKGGMLGTVIKYATAPMRLLVAVVKDIWNAFSGGPSVIAGVFGKVKGFFSSLLDFFKKYGKYFIMAIFPVSAIYFYWDQIMAFFTAMPGRIVAFFTSLPGKIMAALSGLKSQLKDYFMGLAPGWVVKLFGEKSEEKQEVEARAGGGPVSGGKPYLVGEEGPELFVPSGNGSIVPGGGSGGGKAGGGGITISPVLNFYGPASREDASAIADKVQRAIKDCIPAVRGMLGLEAV